MLETFIVAKCWLPQLLPLNAQLLKAGLYVLRLVVLS